MTIKSSSQRLGMEAANALVTTCEHRLSRLGLAGLAARGPALGRSVEHRGPSLPIEFARVGDRGELATVLCPGCPTSPVRWAKLSEPDLVTARKLLRRHEEIPPDRVDGVGSVRLGQPPGSLLGAADIFRWAVARKGIDAVIWTSLPPRFDGVEGRIPNPDEAVAYLRRLTGQERRNAEDYVQRVPAEIQTANRAALEAAIAS